MPLKHSVTSEEFTALPEAQQGLYQQAGDSYTLDVEDDPRVAVLTTKISEFRTNNKALAAKIDGQQAKIDPKNADLATRLAEIETTLETERKEKRTLQRETDRRRFNDAVKDQGRKVGLHPDAVDDMQSRAERAGFRFKEGGVVALDEHGDLVNSKRHEGIQLTLSEWMTDQREGGAKHLFQQSKGVGGMGGGNGNGMKAGARVIVDPSPEFVAANIEKIAEREIIIQRNG